MSSLKASNNTMNTFKRLVTSPIRYPGGKSAAIGFVCELLPKNTKKIVAPFFGGGSLEIALSQNLGIEVVGYDVFDLLVKYWQVQISHPKLLHKKLVGIPPTREMFSKVKERLKGIWEGKIKASNLEIATLYYFNHNTSYGPQFLGWPSSVYLQDTTYKRVLERVKNFLPGKLQVKCASFEKVIKNHPKDFLFCDPPYIMGDTSKMFKPIYPNANFPVHHKGFNHELLRDLLKKHKGGFILCYNNCKTIRDWYKNFKQSFPVWNYTFGQGETRIGKNREEGSKDNIKMSHEIIIFCPPRML